MKNYKVTVKGESGSISYDVVKTYKGAVGVGKKVAMQAFWGEIVEIIVVEI